MARFQFRLPDIGEGVAEAEIVAWHVKAGDRIAEDDPLCDVMTDKATVDMTSPVGGEVIAVHGEVGELKPVGSVLVELEIEGEEETSGEEEAAPQARESERSAPPPAPGPAASPSPAPAPESGPAPAAAIPAETPEPGARRPTPAPTGEDAPGFPLAAPATRRRAAKLGIDLVRVSGTGRNGRVTPEDIDAYLERGSDTRYARREGAEDVKVVGLRRRIADRMAEAKARIPHITYVEEFDLTELETLRETLNAERGDRPRLTILPFLVRALVRTLPDFPDANAHFDDDAGILTRHGAIHVGIATATRDGLMVPVLRHAETLDLWRTAAEIARLSEAARGGTATREELSGSTITITSLGPLGGIATTPIINRPETVIVGPNKIAEKLVRDGQFISARKVMNVSSAFDHRIIDGYEAARMIQAIRRQLEHPALLFMD